jgi:curli biogenesis system outer membrane secretion channel CsgG
MKKLIYLGALVVLTGCTASSQEIVKSNPKPISVKTSSVEPQQTLKRKVAIARFGNEAQYAKSALFGVGNDYNAEKQSTDILTAKLSNSGKFILLERSDIDLVNKEAKDFNLDQLKIGSDYLIVGSVSEFGRKSMADTGVFTRNKIQVAYAKVNVRLIDVKTGLVVFAQEGSGEAKSEAGTAFGVGMHVGYDSTLNDKAISAAISSVVDGLMTNLLSKPWRSYVLSIENDTAMIAGGKLQGVKVNDVFQIYKNGKKIKNPQTGMMIELPGQKIASIKVLSQFGNTYTDEGSICEVISGSLKGVSLNEIYVQK